MNSLNFDIAVLNQLSKDLVDPYINPKDIWALCKKGFLFDIFKADNSTESSYEDKFKNVVNDVIAVKTLKMKHKVDDSLLSGQWLCFNPSLAMFEGLAETETSGFFDSGEVPPPEFWILMTEDTLVSYIPENFVPIARKGVDVCLTGCLYWPFREQWNIVE